MNTKTADFSDISLILKVIFKLSRLIILVILWLLTIKSSAQGFYEIDEKLKLLNSGKKSVSVFKGKELITVINIDSANRTITENTICPKLVGNRTPLSFNDTTSICYRNVTFYSVKGQIDSTILINFNNFNIATSGEIISNKADSTLVIYRYKFLENKILSREYFSIENGVKKHIRTVRFGYNNEDQLVISIEDDGNTQFYYEYNEIGKISAYYVHKTKVNFEYDQFGRKSKDIYGTSTSTYEYDSNSLIIKKITTGKNEGEYTYVYE